MSVRAALSGVLVGLALALVAAGADARPDDSPAPAAPRRAVSVAIRGSNEESRVLSATIFELLARLQLTMLAPGAGTASAGILAQVEIDLGDPAGARVVVRSASGATVLDRRVHDPNPAIEREQIAHAVRGAAEAELLADQDRIAASPADPPPPPPSSPPPVTTAPPPPVVATAAPASVDRDRRPAEAGAAPLLGLDLAVFAGGGPVASTVGPVVRVGGGVTLASRRGLRPSVGLSALYAFPFEAGDDTLGSRTNLVSVRTLASFEVLRRGSLSVGLGAGGGVDVLATDPTSKVLPSGVLRETTTRVDPIASGAAFASVAIVPDVALTLTALVDADFITRSYVFGEAGTRASVLAPWNVRPSLLLGFSFAALGGAAR